MNRRFSGMPFYHRVTMIRNNGKIKIENNKNRETISTFTIDDDKWVEFSSTVANEDFQCYLSCELDWHQGSHCREVFRIRS